MVAGLDPERVKAATDIVAVIGARVPLRKAGRDYAACCPFHDEKTPSFTVSPGKQFYHCFGCGSNGDAIDFVQRFDRVGFPAALAALARDAGIEAERDDGLDAARAQKAAFARSRLRVESKLAHELGILYLAECGTMPLKPKDLARRAKSADYAIENLPRLYDLGSERGDFASGHCDALRIVWDCLVRRTVERSDGQVLKQLRPERHPFPLMPFGLEAAAAAAVYRHLASEARP